MATIERDIGLDHWVVSEGGKVWVGNLPVLDVDGHLTHQANWHCDLVETAIALRKEWLALLEREKAEREPETKLPDGHRWELVCGAWRLVRTRDGTWHPLLRIDSERYAEYKAVTEASNELAARSNPQPVATETQTVTDALSAKGESMRASKAFGTRGAMRRVPQPTKRKMNMPTELDPKEYARKLMANYIRQQLSTVPHGCVDGMTDAQLLDGIDPEPPTD